MSDRKKIALYGYGYVGRALYRFLKSHYDVMVIDPYVDFDAMNANGDEEYPERWSREYSAADGIEHAVVCVPTPTAADGWSCDTSIAEDVLTKTNHISYLVKSTVAPGTIDRLIEKTGKRICFSPEYIGEGKYQIPYWQDMPHPTDMKLHSFHIFGGERSVTTEWLQIFQRVAGWGARYMQTTSVQAELTKYFENMYLATKKIFCDEMYNVCQAFDADYNEVKELWLMDGRIGRSMTGIYPDARGFSGKCLPKDTAAIVAAARAKGYDPKLWAEVIASNKRVRGEEQSAPAPEIVHQEPQKEKQLV
ncbi:MAG: hypothetical protein V1738_04890 [Patescibacteria group bacterium]